MKPVVRTNIKIALAVVAFCIFIACVMVFRIGNFSLGKSDEVKIVFNFVNGLDEGAPVRFGGALIGKVNRVEVLNGAEQKELGTPKNILVIASLHQPVELTQGTQVTVNTMGFIGEKYIEIRPGPTGSPPLTSNLLVGEDPAQMEKLVSSGQKLVDELLVTAQQLNQITAELDARLPGLTDKMDKALTGTERAMSTLGAQETQEQIRASLANLKIITTYGKIFTATVAERPWRLIWGGKLPKLPAENTIVGEPEPSTPNIVIEEKPSKPNSATTKSAPGKKKSP